MGNIRNPIPVKLFIGMLSPDPELFEQCTDMLSREYGSVDLRSDVLAWSTSDYYQEEMGAGIVRKFIFFERLFDASVLPGIKVFTNEIEKNLSVQSGGELHRRINLDPGYVTEAKVVLATAKDFSHRIYIGAGIYAEVTLRYSNAERQFMPCEHTYPDYRTSEYRLLFNRSREILRSSLSK